MSRSITEINQEITNTEASVKRLNEKLLNLSIEKSTLASKAFIEANGITRADVENPEGDGKPLFRNVNEFGIWFRTHPCTKRWASWDGRIYHIIDLMCGRMPDMPGRMEDLP